MMGFIAKNQYQKLLIGLCLLSVIAGLETQVTLALDDVQPLAIGSRPDFFTSQSSFGQAEKSPEPFFLKSLKSTSSVVLTERDFSAWWKQFLSQNRNSQPESKLDIVKPRLPGTQSDADFHPVSHTSALRAEAQWLEYRLKPGDVISLQVLSHPEFSIKNILIAPDGTISLPLLGRVLAGNYSTESLGGLLTQGFAKSLRYPEVTVSLDKIAPQRVYVLGAVKKPGLYLMDGQDSSLSPSNWSNTARLDYHLSTALVKAGGLLADADLAHVKVFNLSQLSCVESNILELLAYGALPNDIFLGLEDIVYVPRLEDSQWNHPEVLKLLANSNLGQETYPIRVYGYVNRPDVYQLSPTEMTLQSVLAKAGLDIDKAQPKNIIVARTLPNQQLRALKVDATRRDMILFPNDSVIVSKSNWKHWTKSAFGAASAITMPAANLKYIIDNNNTITP